jgi:hypothetical protein
MRYSVYGPVAKLPGGEGGSTRLVFLRLLAFFVTVPVQGGPISPDAKRRGYLCGAGQRPYNYRHELSNTDIGHERTCIVIVIEKLIT